MKRLAVLGSTGSIGRQTLEVVRQFPTLFQVTGLAAGRNVPLLLKQVEEFKPALVSLSGPAREAAPMLPSGTRWSTPEEMAGYPSVDLVIVATAGSGGLLPTLAAIEEGKTVALATKEVLVAAGETVMSRARARGVALLPLDSEHSAIWQCLRGESKDEVERLVLTASGGPFRECSAAELAAVTPEQALRHPTWQMGRKVTVDSATLMNKGMEISEARWLFDIPFSRIEVLVHPQSIVHSFVEFVDGSTKAQLGPSDMRLPIQHALAYPDRLPSNDFARLDWSRLQSLTFSPPDTGRFPCLKLALQAGEAGGTYPAVLCGADEAAVELFLQGRIRFTDIATMVESALESHQSTACPSLEEIMSAEAWAGDHARDWSQRRR